MNYTFKNSHQLVSRFGRDTTYTTGIILTLEKPFYRSSTPHVPEVAIRARTSKGNASSNYIMIPLEDIPELIKEMEAFWYKNK